MPNEVDLELAPLLGLARNAARQAGTLLIQGLGSERDAVATKSSPTDMVSEMDQASEELVRALLRTARPHDAILGEEGGLDPGPPDHPDRPDQASPSIVRWIVDPLDGTTNYLYGFPAWAVSVAAEVGGRVAVGAVYDPGRDELFSAELGRGATCNGRPLRVEPSPGKGLDTALIGTGFAYEGDRRAVQGAIIAHVLPRIRDIRRAGAAALDLCWVAARRLDAFYEQGIKLWDWAAGGLIAAEAGAWIGGFDGGPPSTDGIIAARPDLAVPLRSLLHEALEAANGRGPL